MLSKVCNTCNIEKNISEYRIRSDNGKYQNKCKLCFRIYDQEYRIKNIDRIKQYLKNNKKNINLKHRKRNVKWRLNNPDYNKKYYEKNKNILSIKYKEYCNNNREKINIKAKLLKQKNPLYKLKINIRNRIYRALKQNYKTGMAIDALGCSIKELKNWLGIIGNYYDSKNIHIDHIIPLSLYDLSKESEQKKAFNYRNLRLISRNDNLSKGNNLDKSLINLFQIKDLLPNLY